MDDIKVNQNPKLGSFDRPNSYIGRSLPRENAKKNILKVVDSSLMT